MSKHTVVTPFSTPSRRFAAGQTVTEADITGPLSLAERVALGQIAAPPPAPEAPTPEAATPKGKPAKPAPEADPAT